MCVSVRVCVCLAWCILGMPLFIPQCLTLTLLCGFCKSEHENSSRSSCPGSFHASESPIMCVACVCMHANVRISVCSVWQMDDWEKSYSALYVYMILCMFSSYMAFYSESCFTWFLSIHANVKLFFTLWQALDNLQRPISSKYLPFSHFSTIFRTDSVQLYSHIGKVQKLRHALLLYMYCDSCRVKYIMFYFVFSFWFFFSQRMQKVSSFKAFFFVLFWSHFSLILDLMTSSSVLCAACLEFW